MVDVISQFLTSGSKLTDAIELFGTDFELANQPLDGQRGGDYGDRGRHDAAFGRRGQPDLSRVPLL